MLTATDVARQLGVSRRHVYALAERGELQAYRFGDAVRFAPEDLGVAPKPKPTRESATPNSTPLCLVRSGRRP